MKYIFPVILAAAGCSVVPSTTTAQHTTHSGHDHGQAITLPTEPGQDTFAALTEIVTMLRADPSTDWSNVDIAALHRHLIDMDDLMQLTDVEQTAIDGGLQISLPAEGTALRMVPAHAPVLEAETGWTSIAEQRDDRLIWRITGDAAQIRALGFYGLMATGDHHRPHHLGIARGKSVH
ncbi:MAG: hypothetical protein AAFV87_18375 [Pseudomonadota bacterium]